MKKKIFTTIIILICTIFLLNLAYTGIVKYKNYLRQNKLNKNKNIDIVLTSDKNYTLFTKVAIKSAIMNKNKDSVYNLHVLCVDLSDKECKSFEKFQGENINIKTIPLKLDTISNIGNYELDHYVTRADLFKFLMPDIFNDLDKILYIDSDTLIIKDLSTLYNTDITDYYLAAVRKHISPKINVNLFKNIYARVEITHYNCGVMVLNLKKMRDDNIKEKLIEAKNNDQIRRLQTQQSFNEVIPYEISKHISPVYNALARWEDMEFFLLDFKKIYKPFLDDIFFLQELYDNAVIIHYAGPLKPWNNNDVRYFDKWWEYAHMINPKVKYGDFGFVK